MASSSRRSTRCSSASAPASRLSADELAALADAPDILPLGMLADALRRRLRGTQVTYLRVASCAFDQSFADAVPPAAREVRITGAPATLDVAVTAVRSAKAVAGDRDRVWVLRGATSSASHRREAPACRARWKSCGAAGLDALAELPLDARRRDAARRQRLRTPVSGSCG